MLLLRVIHTIGCVYSRVSFVYISSWPRDMAAVNLYWCTDTSTLLFNYYIRREVSWSRRFVGRFVVFVVNYWKLQVQFSWNLTFMFSIAAKFQYSVLRAQGQSSSSNRSYQKSSELKCNIWVVVKDIWRSEIILSWWWWWWCWNMASNKIQDGVLA